MCRKVASELLVLCLQYLLGICLLGEVLHTALSVLVLREGSTIFQEKQKVF